MAPPMMIASYSHESPEQDKASASGYQSKK
jgi:hypothetical protein